MVSIIRLTKETSQIQCSYKIAKTTPWKFLRKLAIEDFLLQAFHLLGDKANGVFVWRKFATDSRGIDFVKRRPGVYRFH